MHLDFDKKSLFGLKSHSWKDLRMEISAILSQGEKLTNYVQLIGKENLAQEQQLILFTTQMIKQNFLIQNAYNEIDRYSSPFKTIIIASIIYYFYEYSVELIKFGIPLFKIQELECIQTINQLRFLIKNDDFTSIVNLKAEMDREFEVLKNRMKKLMEV